MSKGRWRSNKTYEYVAVGRTREGRDGNGKTLFVTLLNTKTQKKEYLSVEELRARNKAGTLPKIANLKITADGKVLGVVDKFDVYRMISRAIDNLNRRMGWGLCPLEGGRYYSWDDEIGNVIFCVYTNAPKPQKIGIRYRYTCYVPTVEYFSSTAKIIAHELDVGRFNRVEYWEDIIAEHVDKL